MRRILLIVLAISIFTSSRVFAQSLIDDVSPNYASALDQISLSNYDGTIVSLSSYRNMELTVYIFLGHECPICQKYGHKLRTFHKQFQEQNIDFIGIIPLRDVELNTIAKYASLYDFKFPILSDKERILTDLLDATVTPEVIVVDAAGDLVYRGMIDNWFYALGKYRRVTTEYYLEDAISAYRNQEQVAVKETDPIGCFINMTSYQTN